jgi:hypothetical protein
MMFNKNSHVIDWLLEESDPSVRYLALTELLGREKEDPEIKLTKKSIVNQGWARSLVEKLTPSESWDKKARIWQPKYSAPFWVLLVLSDLGLARDNLKIDKACQVWMNLFATEDGGFSAFSKKEGHLCITGNMARALVKFGYEDRPSVEKAFQWFVKNESERGGGWSCWNWGGHRKGRNLDSWELLSAFAAYPKQKWTRSMKQTVERSVEFYLEHELHKQGARYEPWYRFHYPHHYYYDILIGLDFVTSLGYSGDKRLAYALSLLKEKRRPDGKWNLDAINPDPESPQGKWNKEHPKEASIPLVLEKAGEPSKIITLNALRVVQRLGEEVNSLGF